VTGIINLKSVEKIVNERFRRDIAEKNFAVIKEAYEEVKSK
jgi:Pyruvate/2-oxoacid:ferredoxin oxidoreductase gamma subunit